MGKKLRPCPWCGTTPLYVEKYVYDNKWTQYRVGCEQHDCGAQPTVDWHYFTEQEAIDAWNNQAVAMENESLKAENDKLRELLKNALTYIEYEGCGVECPETGHGATLTSCDVCNRYETESCAYVIAQSARELGVEVPHDN